MIKFRASSLHRIMCNAKCIDTSLLDDELKIINSKKIKTKEEQEALQPYRDATLSEGAKSYIRQLFKQNYYGVKFEISSKEMEKGNAVEHLSIELYNEVFFKSYEKNAVSYENEWITGTPDIVDIDSIVDIKSPWSLSTFPLFKNEMENDAYEWQLRSYMMLADKSKAELAYCMVDTPEHLIGYENEDLHIVSHIPNEMRISRLMLTREPTKEHLICIKVAAAREYYEQLKAEKTA